MELEREAPSDVVFEEALRKKMTEVESYNTLLTQEHMQVRTRI